MRVIAAIDQVLKKEWVVYSGNLPNCFKWALERAQGTDRPIKIIVAYPGSQDARVFAEATTEGIRPVHAGVPIPIKKLKQYL